MSTQKAENVLYVQKGSVLHMKKLTVSILSIFSMLTLASCGIEDIENNENSVAENTNANTAESYADNEDIREEISEAVEKISDAVAFKSGNFTMFGDNSKYRQNYADLDTELEVSGKYDDTYSPLNPDVAADEDGLFNYLRGCFTENYISDGDLKNELFTAADESSVPSYKTVDGILCMRVSYRGYGIRINADEITDTAEYTENSAAVTVMGYGSGDPSYKVYMSLEKSPEYGWRLDSIEYKEDI